MERRRARLRLLGSKWSCKGEGRFVFFIAGWSSLVARQAHNLKVGGSNPSPATNLFTINQ